MKQVYISPQIKVEKIESVNMSTSSHKTGKPGHGYGTEGHDGPPGHKTHDDFDYEFELWEY